MLRASFEGARSSEKSDQDIKMAAERIGDRTGKQLRLQVRRAARAIACLLTDRGRAIDTLDPCPEGRWRQQGRFLYFGFDFIELG